MFIVPAITAEDGSIQASEPIPASAIRTTLSPDGCIVYEEGDEQLLAERLPAQEQQ